VEYAIGAIAGVLFGVAVGKFLFGRVTPSAAAKAPPPPPPAPPKKNGAPLRLLALMQAESRFVDFLMEDISAASDEQVGQAVRDIHRKAGQVLKQQLVLEPILAQKEDETTTVPKGFNPSAIRVLGNVTGEPPFEGTVQHPGWRVKDIKLSAPGDGVDEFVLQPAEVVLG
jgi:hypothetical protein